MVFSIKNKKKRPDGRIYDGEWFNGKQHGVGTFRNAKGIIITAEWNNGLRVKKPGENISSHQQELEIGDDQ